MRNSAPRKPLKGRRPSICHLPPCWRHKRGGKYVAPESRRAMKKRANIWVFVLSSPFYCRWQRGGVFFLFFLSGLSKHTFTTNKQQQKREGTLAFHPPGRYGAPLTVKRLSKYTMTNRNTEQRPVPVSTSEGFLEKKKKGGKTSHLSLGDSSVNCRMCESTWKLLIFDHFSCP